jgi:hypothetical protein
LLAHGRWFSPNTLASSTTKTGRHDIAESGVKHNKSNQINDIAEKRLTCNQTTMIHSLCYTQSKGDNSVIHNQRETTLLYTIKGRQLCYTQSKGDKQENVFTNSRFKRKIREYQRANQKWTIQRNWQQDEEKQNKNTIQYV